MASSLMPALDFLSPIDRATKKVNGQMHIGGPAAAAVATNTTARSIREESELFRSYRVSRGSLPVSAQPGLGRFQGGRTISEAKYTSYVLFYICRMARRRAIGWDSSSYEHISKRKRR